MCLSRGQVERSSGRVGKGRVHVQASCGKPRFQNLGFEKEKLFNELDDASETFIYWNNYF